VHISVQKAVVTVEWSSYRAQRRRDKDGNQLSQLFFFQFKLSGAVKNCVFSATSEMLNVSFEKLERQLWSSPIETALIESTTHKSTGKLDDFQSESPSLLQMRQQEHHTLPRQHTQQHSIDSPHSSTLSSLSLNQGNSSVKIHVSKVPACSTDEKHARIAAILYAKKDSKQMDRFSSATSLTATLPNVPVRDSVEPSLLAEMRSSLQELNARLQQQTAHIADLRAAASAASSLTEAARAQSRDSLSKLASTVSDLEKCRVELDLERAQTSVLHQRLAMADSFAEEQTRARTLSEAKVLALETRLKEVAAAMSCLQRDLDTKKSKVDACVGYDAIPPEDDSLSGFSLTDCIEDSQLLLSMAEQGFVLMRHRNQILLDRFYENEALRLHRILTHVKKRRVTFKSQLDVGEFLVNDSPDSVSFARKSVHDAKFDVANKLQKRRKKCEGQTKWLHAEAQSMCLSSHSICASTPPAICMIPAVLSCKGRVIGTFDLQSWFSVASSCTKFDLHAPIISLQSASVRDHSHPLLMKHSPDGLCSLDAVSGGLSHAALIQLCFAFRGCSTLRSLDFSFNIFSELVAASLGSLLGTACIAHLRLSSCDITSSHISRMRLAVPWLSELDVSNNDIRDDGILTLSLYLQTQTCSLKKLNCANNSLSSLSCKTLCAALELNSSLQSLILDDNVSFVLSGFSVCT
jgi:hypothetical protein